VVTIAFRLCLAMYSSALLLLRSTILHSFLAQQSCTYNFFPFQLRPDQKERKDICVKRTTTADQPMKLGLVENSWWGTKIDRITGIRIAKEYGFDNYAILMEDMTPRLRRKMRKTLENEGLPVSSFLSVATSLE